MYHQRRRYPPVGRAALISSFFRAVKFRLQSELVRRVFS